MKKTSDHSCLYVATVLALASIIAPTIFGQETRTGKVEPSAKADGRRPIQFETTPVTAPDERDKFKLPLRSRNEEAIRQVLARFEEALLKRDARIYAVEFVDDADWEDAFGSRESGRPNIEKRLAGIYKMFQLADQITELRIRFITSDVAVVDVDREIFAPVSADGVKKHPLRKVRTTHVFMRKKGNWRVVVFRVAELRSAQDAQ